MSKCINVFLLDDDALFLQVLRDYLTDHLAGHAPYPCALHSFECVSSMMGGAESVRPDLLISDIELPEAENGISGASALRAIAPGCSIIYLTSYLQYAPQIFETEPLYFVMKDQYQENLPKALSKFFEHYRKANQKLQISSGGKSVSVPIDEILYCEHSGKYIKIICRQERYSVRSSITDFLPLLPQDQFALCHSSFIVNLAHVKSLTSLCVKLDDGTEINVSRTCRDAFRQAHSKWLSGLL